MNKIEQMLQELCPNGVEYKKLTDICSLSRGKVYSKTYLSENVGNYPVYSSQTANNGELGKYQLMIMMENSLHGLRMEPMLELYFIGKGSLV